MTANYVIETIDVGTSSQALVALGGREYTQEYVALPNANLPKQLRNQLNQIFSYLTGEELPLEENTFLIKSKDGIYSRLFGPVLKAGSSEVEGLEDNKLYIQWGPRYIPVGIEKGGFSLSNGTALEAEFSMFNFSGRGEDAALMISLDNENGQLIMPIAVRFSDWENPTDPKVLNSLLKKKPEDIISLIQTVAARTTGSGQRVQADVEIDFRSLEVNYPYNVIHYYPCKTSYGTSYRIMIDNVDGFDGQVAGCWAHSSIRPLLASKPEITQEKPATLTLRSKEELDNGKIRIRSTLLFSSQSADDSSLNLNF